jgi:DNA-binding transcriptional LysR family regulator
VRSRLRLRHLVLLEALAKRQNIRQAAADLFISQPAASKLLQEIESIFGVQLYDRDAHGIQPTPSGEVALYWARKVIADMDAAQAELSAIESGHDGRVRVGVFPVAAPVLVPRAIARLRERKLQVEVSLREGLEDTLIPALKQGLLDCVIGRLTPETRSRSVDYEVLYEEPTAVVAGPDHLLARRWSPSSLNRYQWILPSDIAPLYALVAAGLAAVGADPPRVAVQTSSVLMIIKTLQNTNLLSALALGVSLDYAESKQLAILPLELSAALHPVCIITPHGSPANPATAAFLRSLREAAAERAQYAFNPPSPRTD